MSVLCHKKCKLHPLSTHYSTSLQTDYSTLYGIVAVNIKQMQSKSMDLQFCWLGDGSVGRTIIRRTMHKLTLYTVSPFCILKCENTSLAALSQSKNPVKLHNLANTAFLYLSCSNLFESLTIFLGMP